MSCHAGSSFGTNSPAHELAEDPMGVCSIRGDRARSLSDAEQRKEYVHDEKKHETSQQGQEKSSRGEKGASNVKPTLSEKQRQEVAKQAEYYNDNMD